VPWLWVSVFLLSVTNRVTKTDIVYTFDTRKNVWENHGTKLPKASADIACEYMELQNGKKVILIVGIYIQNVYLDMANEAGGWIIDSHGLWYYCAVTGESKKIVFTSGATEKITSGGATSDFWSPHK
jgi:hypothetical protein